MADNNSHGQPKETQDRRSEGTAGGVRRLWTNYTPLQGTTDNTPENKKAEEEYKRRVKTNASILNNISHQNLNIWQSVSTGSTYTGGQGIIEAMQSIKKDDNIFFFDFENLGTHTKDGKKRKSDKMSFYAPTELAIQRATVNADFTMSRTNKGLSLLLAPTGDNVDKLENLISKIQGMKGRTWTGLTADEWRTANDLILYSNSADFEKDNGITFIKGQNRDAQAAGNPDSPTIFTSKQVALMRKGMDNLLKHGNTPDQVAESLVSYFGDTGGKFKMGGFNIKQFDIPMMMDYLDNGLAKHVKNSKTKVALQRLRNDIANVQHVDTFQALTVGYKDKASRFGNTLKQEELAKKYRLGTGTAHMGIDDVRTNIRLHNALVRKEGLMDVFGGNHAASAIQYNNKNLNVGDRLFSLNGLADFETEKHDDVFALDKDGKFVPAYNASRQLTPFSKNTAYTVHKTFQHKLSGGKEQFGVLLKNEDTGYFHMLARHTREELQEVLHRKTTPIENALQYMDESRGMSQVDRARRKWDKMFNYESGGGRYLVQKMLKLHDVHNDWVSNGFGGDALKDFVINDPRLYDEENKRNIITPELYRDYSIMKDRFDAESGYLKEFISRLDEEMPRTTPKKIPASHNVALKAYSDILNERLGENRGEFGQGEGRRHLSLEVDKSGAFKNIDLTNQYTIARNMSNFVQYKTQPTSTVKARLKTAVNEARTQGMSSSQAAHFNRMIDSLEDGQKAFYIMEEISTAIADTARAKKDFGLKTISLADPTKVSKLEDGTGRLDKMNDTTFKNSVFNEALDRSWIFDHKGFDKDRNINIVDTTFNELLKSHDKSVEQIHKHVRGDESNIKVARAKDTLSQLVRSYTRDGVKAQLLYDEKRKGLFMVMAEQKVAERVFGLDPNAVLSHEEVARVALPMFDGNGNLRMPGQERIGRLKIFDRGRNSGDNQFIFGTAFEEVAYGLGKRSSGALRMLKEGNAGRVSSMLKSAVNEDIQSYSINSKYSKVDDMYRQDTRQSRTARYARSGHIDMTQFAQDWYEWMYKRKNKNEYKKNMQRKQDMMGADRSLTFFNTLNKDELRNFHMTIDSYAKKQHNLFTDMHNVKDTHTAQGMRSASSADVRNLLAFGYLDPMARENIMKHGNYLNLDEGMTRENLRAADVPEERIDRMLRRGVMTDVAKEVLSGETAFLSLRTAYTNNSRLLENLSKNGIVDELASVYDGGIIVREDVAQAFTTTREKKVTLSEGAILPDKIRALFENNSAFKELEGGGYQLKQGSKLDNSLLLSNFADRDTRHGSSTHGQLTVGVIAKGDVEQGVNFLKGHNDNVFIKGLTVGEDGTQKLLLETLEVARDGTKLGSDSGDRSTMIIRSKEWFEKAGYGDSEVIAEQFDEKKKMEGAKTRSITNLAVDMIQEKLTVGQMATDERRLEAMQTLANIMQDKLKGTEIAKVTKDGVFVKSVIGLSTDIKFGQKDINAFAREVEDKFSDLGVKMTPDRGQVGYTVADVYNWENQVGYVQGRNVKGGAGGVRWGYKESTMIERRANKIFGTDDNDVTKWLRNHMKVAAGEDNIERYIKGVHRSVLDMTDSQIESGNLRAGDLVVTSQGDSFSASDAAGKTTGRVRNGVTEVSMHAFNDLPEKLNQDDKLTVGRYQKTILTAGDVDVDINGERKSLQNIIDKNNGSFLFQLPEGFSRKYVRMVDQDLVGLGVDGDGTPVLQNLQKQQLQLWRSVKEYTNDGGSNSYKKVQSAINNYEGAMADIAGSVNKGSIADLRSARMDMSGRFRTQGVNPLADGTIKEGEVRIGKEHLKRMIQGAEIDIMKAVDAEGYQKLLNSHNKAVNNITPGEGAKETKEFLKKRHLMEVQQKVLDHAKDKGLYGIINRYPTIDTDGLQVLKVMWDDRIKGDNGVMGIATAFATNSDYDGDFFSAVLSHYKKEAGSPNGAAMHSALGKIHKEDTKSLDKLRDNIVADMRLKGMNEETTVKDIAKDDVFKAKYGDLYDVETGIARTGKSDVGVLDNIRYKLHDIATPVYKLLEQERGMDSKTVNWRVDHMEEFGRIISQNAISSKKFSQDKVLLEVDKDVKAGILSSDTNMELEAKRRMTSGRYGALDDLVRGLKLGNEEGANLIRHANKSLGLFLSEGDEIDFQGRKISYSDSMPEMDRVFVDQKYSLETFLDTMQTTRSYVGKQGWLDNIYGKVAVSGGPNLEQMGDIYRNRGGLYTDTPAMRSVENVSEEMRSVAEKGKTIYRSSILSNYDMINSEQDDIFDATSKSTYARTAPATDTMLSTATVAEDAGVKLRQVMGQVTGGGMSMGAMRGSSMAWGAGMFGAMWAGSAIVRSGPTPEGLQEQVSSDQYKTAAMGPQQQPTARIQRQDTAEHINLRINANDAKGMTQEQISALVQSELGAMTSMQMNMNLNVNDNTQNIDQQWLQGIVANAIDKGFGF